MLRKRGGGGVADHSLEQCLEALPNVTFFDVTFSALLAPCTVSPAGSWDNPGTVRGPCRRRRSLPQTWRYRLKKGAEGVTKVFIARFVWLNARRHSIVSRFRGGGYVARTVGGGVCANAGCFHVVFLVHCVWGGQPEVPI